MLHPMKLLALAGDGMDIVGVIVGAWYVSAKYQQRIRTVADRQLAQGLGARPAAEPSGPGSILGILGAGAAADEDIETGAEELLAARLARFGEPVVGLVEGWWEWLWRKLAPLGWLRLVVSVPLGLALLGMLMVLCAILLPFLIVGFLLDRDRDYACALLSWRSLQGFPCKSRAR
jgi:hypothetical protein